MCFMPVTDLKTVKNRVHLDLTSGAEDREAEIERLLALGARRVDVGRPAGGHRPDHAWLHHTGMVIRLGVPADLAAVAGVYRSASLSNARDRDNLLAHPEYLIMGPEGLAEGRTHVAEEDGSVVGFATWAWVGGTAELADLFVDPGWMRRGIATALVGRIADVVRSRGLAYLEVTANPLARGFYRAAGFIECGVAETAFGSAPRMLLAIRLPTFPASGRSGVVIGAVGLVGLVGFGRGAGCADDGLQRASGRTTRTPRPAAGLLRSPDQRLAPLERQPEPGRHAVHDLLRVLNPVPVDAQRHRGRPAREARVAPPGRPGRKEPGAV